jgi:hypothetical protein
MQFTLVAVFDSKQQADAACDALVAAGIPKDSVRLRTGHDEEPAPVRPHGWNPFDWMFGDADGRFEAEEYAEAVRRGGIAVVVEGLDHPDEAAGILSRNGAVDVDQRLSQWRAAGWRGGAAGADVPSRSVRRLGGVHVHSRSGDRAAGNEGRGRSE